MKKSTFALALAALAIGSVAYAETADEAHLRPRWMALDVDKDGRVMLSELTPNQAAAQRRNDLNGDGEISLAEYVAADLDPGGSARAPLPDNVRMIADIPYAGTDDPRQRVDIYMPKTPAGPGPLPVIAFVHGGGWSTGSKIMAKGLVLPLVNSGRYIAVSIGYRLSWQAPWPAQIYDSKAGIRWIRAHAREYGMDPKRICAMGPSAGGHLAAHLGVTNGVKEVEGDVGKDLKQSSDVQCAIDMFGPTDLRPFVAEGAGENGRTALFGPNKADWSRLASNASPITFVDRKDVPFLIIHGTRDNTVNYQESVNLEAALRKAGVPVLFQSIENGGHGDFGAALPEMNARILAFLDHVFYDPKIVVATDLLKK